MPMKRLSSDAIVAAGMGVIVVVAILVSYCRPEPRAAALTFYVSLTGSDGGDGSASRPWRHLDRAVAQLRPGDRLCIGAGTWSDRRDVIDTQTNTIPSGTDLGAGAITIGACNGDVAVLKPPAGMTAVRLTYGTGAPVHHLIIQDLSFDGSLQPDPPPGTAPDGSPELLYTSSGAHHLRFERLHLAHTMSHAVQFASTNADASIETAITIADSVFEDIGNATGDSGHGGSGINNGYALYSWTAGARIHGNTFRDNRGTALVVYGPRNVVDGNLFDRNATRGGSGAYAVNFGSSSHPVPTSPDGFVNNVVVNQPGGGVQVYTSADVAVVNNTFAGNPNWAVHLQYCGTAFVQNNIFQGAATDIVNDSPGACIPTADHNLPSTVDARLTSDYRITPTSPAFDAGTMLPRVTVDRLGTPRPQGSAYDQGAYEVLATVPPVPGVTYSITGSVTVEAGGTVRFSGTGVPAGSR